VLPAVFSSILSDDISLLFSLSLGCAKLFHTIAVAALPTHSILFLAIDSR
jgi:hypothetical protein